MPIGQQIKSLRKVRGLSQAALAFRLGLTQQAVAKWEADRSSPDLPMLVKLASVLEIEPDQLLGTLANAFDIRPYMPDEQKPVPILGVVRAGYGLPADEEDQGLELASVSDPSRYFYLVVQGDSMEPGIRDQDLALIRKQSTLEDGDLGVVVYGDGEGTIKRYHKKGPTVALQAFNPAYETVILSGEELEKMYIIGKVIETKTRW